MLALHCSRQEVRVERFSFAPEAAFVPRSDLLDHVSVAPLTSPFEEGALVQAAIFRFEPGGRLRGGRGMPQILAVLEGSGEVSGANGVDEPIGAGEAVFLHEGEDHGMKSEAGLTVLNLQGANLDRFRARPKPPASHAPDLKRHSRTRAGESLELPGATTSLGSPTSVTSIARSDDGMKMFGVNL
jgi:quercetin dioxygenase-like cupin family protein